MPRMGQLWTTRVRSCELRQEQGRVQVRSVRRCLHYLPSRHHPSLAPLPWCSVAYSAHRIISLLVGRATRECVHVSPLGTRHHSRCARGTLEYRELERFSGTPTCREPSRKKGSTCRSKVDKASQNKKGRNRLSARVGFWNDRVPARARATSIQLVTIVLYYRNTTAWGPLG